MICRDGGLGGSFYWVVDLLLSYRDVPDLLSERGIHVDPSTINRQGILQQAQRNCGLYPPATLVTDKAPTYPAIIQSMGVHAYYNEPVKHIDQKWRNNRIESDHAALKRLIKPAKGFQTLRTAKATLLRVEAFRTIKRGDIFKPAIHAGAELRLINHMFGIAA